LIIKYLHILQTNTIAINVKLSHCFSFIGDVIRFCSLFQYGNRRISLRLGWRRKKIKVTLFIFSRSRNEIKQEDTYCAWNKKKVIWLKQFLKGYTQFLYAYMLSMNLIYLFKTLRIHKIYIHIYLIVFFQFRLNHYLFIINFKVTFFVWPINKLKNLHHQINHHILSVVQLPT
jgi:hypothetical protein